MVDDGSKTPLDSVVTPLKNKININLLRQENAGLAAAINKGAEMATKEFFAFTDDDCQPTADGLNCFAAGFNDDPEAMIGGKTINA